MSRTRIDSVQLWESLKVLTLRALYLSGILCILGSIWLFCQAYNPRQGALQSQCKSNLKQIMIAVHYYHEEFGLLPPPFTTDENGKRLHSWRTLILPYLDQQDLYDRIRLNEPWNSPHNLDLVTRFEDSWRPFFRCPGNPTEEGVSSQETSYVAIVGPRSAWRLDGTLSLHDVTDGTANTLSVVEVADSGIHWMEPRDLYVGQMSMEINSLHGQGISSYHTSPHHNRDGSTADFGVSHVGILDGAIRSLPASMPGDLLEQLLTIDDGLPLEGWGDRLDRSR